MTLVLSPSEALGSAGIKTGAASAISLYLPRKGAPIAPYRLSIHANIGASLELARILQTVRETELATRLANAADRAYGLFRWDVIGSIGDLLVESAATPQSLIIGRFYQALGMNRLGFGDTAGAAPLFELVANEGPSRYRARALVALGNNLSAVKDHVGAVSIWREAIEILSSERYFDAVTFFSARKNSAVARALLGDHRGSLDELQSLLPLARLAGSVQPHVYYDYLNGLAVELGEAGRLDEALRLSTVAATSPFSSVFTAYRETLDEITVKRRRASRSMVAPTGAVATPRRRDAKSVKRSPERRARNAETNNVLMLKPGDRQPVIERTTPAETPGTARVLSFQQWKANAQRPSHLPVGRLAPEERASMTTGEKLIRLMDLISRDETDDEMIDSILEVVETIVLGQADRILD